MDKIKTEYLLKDNFMKYKIVAIANTGFIEVYEMVKQKWWQTRPRYKLIWEIHKTTLKNIIDMIEGSKR